MKTNCMFNYELLFGDYMAKVSDKAKLYYIKLCFYANNGFVANPLSVLDSMGVGYDKSVYDELVGAGELLTLPDRCEVFITSYFVHNHFNSSSWTHTIYYPYWKGKLWTKKNGVATFKQQSDEEEPKIEEPKIEEPKEDIIPKFFEEPKEEIVVSNRDDLTEDDLPFPVHFNKEA